MLCPLTEGNMYKSAGALQYNDQFRAVVWVDRGIADYYFNLIPKYYYAQRQKYHPHITVVRPKYEVVKNKKLWNKYNGEVIEYTYDGMIHFDGTYFYLNVYSDRIGNIREELGLPRFRFNDLGSKKRCYHITIGNIKK